MTQNLSAVHPGKECGTESVTGREHRGFDADHDGQGMHVLNGDTAQGAWFLRLSGMRADIRTCPVALH